MGSVRIKRPPKVKAEVQAESLEPAVSESVWGAELDAGNHWMKLPREICRLWRYLNGMDVHLRKRLKVHHVMLLLALANRWYKRKPLRVYWETLSEDLGVSKPTIRRWAYQLKNMKLLTIKEVRGRDPIHNHVGFRNESNLFSLSPFIELLLKAREFRKKDNARQKAAWENGDDE